MKHATALGLITAVIMALRSAAVNAQPYSYRHHYYGYYGGPVFGHSSREGMMSLPRRPNW